MGRRGEGGQIWFMSPSPTLTEVALPTAENSPSGAAPLRGSALEGEFSAVGVGVGVGVGRGVGVRVGVGVGRGVGV